MRRHHPARRRRDDEDLGRPGDNQRQETLGTWLLKNPSRNWQTLTYAQFDKLFAQSVSEFSGVIATDNPGLAAFKAHGGKIIIWHGLADRLIFTQETINYYQRVQRAMVSWVERGSAPTAILGVTIDPATGVVTDSRPVCEYPRFARYTGHGSTTVASSFVCA